jgi:hypothetical protein
MGGWNPDSPTQRELDELGSLGAGRRHPTKEKGATVVVETEDSTGLAADQDNLDAGLGALVLTATVGARRNSASQIPASVHLGASRVSVALKLRS